MTKENNKTIIEIFSSKSNCGIIKEFKRLNRPLQFKDLKLLTNPKSNRKYSSKTIAICLKELESNGIIKNEIIENKRRKRLGYAITPKGYFACRIVEEAQISYEKLSKKKLIKIKNN